MERSWDTGLPVVCGGIVGVWLGCVRGASEASDFERARFSWLHVGLARAVENGGLRFGFGGVARPGGKRRSAIGG